MFDNQQGLIVENLGSSNGASISVYSSGDRFFENGGGATVGSAFGPSNNNTLNFTAVGSAFENNNGTTDFYRGGLNVAGSISFQTANGGSNNTANVNLRNCRFANNQVADLAAFGASSLPVTIGSAGTNNRVNVKLFGTVTPNTRVADSDPVNPAGVNSAKITRQTPFDFDGDSRADISVFRPSEGNWWSQQSTNGFAVRQFGLSTDKLAPADFDGDGKTDIAVYRNGVWWWINSSNNQVRVIQFGQTGDIPQPADFDGDGRSELVVWRLNQNLTPTWYVHNLANNSVTVTPSTISSADLNPVIGDFNGDGRADYAMFDANETLNWHIIYNGVDGGFSTFFGVVGDKVVPADYDSDGKTDLAVYRAGTWFVLQSASGFTQFQFGISSDIPTPADYDGDGKADAAVYRDGTWYLRQSTNGVSFQQFGLTNDKPIPAAYLP